MYTLEYRYPFKKEWNLSALTLAAFTNKQQAVLVSHGTVSDFECIYRIKPEDLMPPSQEVPPERFELLEQFRITNNEHGQGAAAWVAIIAIVALIALVLYLLVGCIGDPQCIGRF